MRARAGRYTQEEIAETVGVTQQTVTNEAEEIQILSKCSNLVKVSAKHVVTPRACARALPQIYHWNFQ